MKQILRFEANDGEIFESEHDAFVRDIAVAIRANIAHNEDIPTKVRITTIDVEMILYHLERCPDSRTIIKRFLDRCEKGYDVGADDDWRCAVCSEIRCRCPLAR